MENLFVPYELAVKLKEKEFKGTTINSTYYHIKYKTLHDYSYFSAFENMLHAPIYQQVIDWVREKYNTHIYVSPIIIQTGGKSGHRYSFSVENFNNNKECFDETPLGYLTYYEALNKAIEESLKLI